MLSPHVRRAGLERPTLACVLAVLMAWSAACRVYDSRLVTPSEQAVPAPAGTAGAGVSTGSSAPVPTIGVGPAPSASPPVPPESIFPSVQEGIDSGAGLPPADDLCGNGLLDPGELCDIAKASGTAGSCPSACSGGQGCARYVLEGSACTARCVPHTVTERHNDDDCCPEGADWSADHDCPPRCGNGVVEPGETCDPGATCVAPNACASNDACVIRRFAGARESCTARCEEQRIESCVSGDACCPTGCDRTTDTDCVTPPAMSEPGRPSPAGCDGSFTRTACQTCECTRCAQARATCLEQPEAAATACAAVTDCAAREECDALWCYCGDASAVVCDVYANGPCASEMRSAAGSGRLLTAEQIASDVSTPLGRAVALIDCRQANCAADCGL